MTTFRAIIVAALAAVAMPAELAAQEVVQPLGLTEADLLATQMRQLAANPRDLQALATAGELSIRLGDLSGAAALFARADKVDPRSGRVKAGMGSILVRSERPGEALRFFQQAESYGWSPARFAADRGLAYDLIGEGERAQRDYRLALRSGKDDETVRRYALSLGIAGRQAQALEQLDPLVRRQDRAAWRARAFVLAMGGDTAGAAKIAAAMMPAAMGQGLGAFFQRLPALSATDRAFAVHFGEIYATPERLADARLAPRLAPLTPEPGIAPAGVQVTAASAPLRQNDRRGGAPVQSAPVRSVAPGSVVQPPARQSAGAPTRVAGTSTVRPSTGPQGGALTPAQGTRRGSAPLPVGRVALAAAAPAPTVAAPATSSASAGVTPVVLRSPAATPAGSTSSPPVQVASVRPTATSPVAAPTGGPVTPIAVSGPPAPQAPPRSGYAPQVAAPAPASAPVAPVESAAVTARADSVLARIVANLSIPAAELGIAPIRPDPAPIAVPVAVERAPASPEGKRVVAEASAKEARDVAVRRVVAATLTGDAQADEPDTTGRRTRNGRTPTLETLAAKDVPATAKTTAAARKKAAADKQAAAEKKALADKAAAEKKAARAHPPRIWVQVAAGANQRDLDRTWSQTKGKATALASRTGYSTPVRASNRVLTGPFKTAAEARALVNQLAKQGVSAFSFTSEAGQEITKLGGK